MSVGSKTVRSDLGPANTNCAASIVSDSERMETTAAHFAQIVEVESRSVSGMMGTYISELVARGGIEPPTRGFSVTSLLRDAEPA